MTKKSLILFSIFIYIFSVFPALATEPSSILMDIVPENPAPLENTNITLKSFAVNLDSVLISWFVNGKSALSGIGKKSFFITSGNIGSETKVEAKIFLPDGEVDKRAIIRPSAMVLLWQANDSYVPPFYKGKAMPSTDSEIKVVAMPEIKTASGMVDPNNMTYVWQKDYNNMAGDSGYGKNFFIYTNDYLENSNNVAVVAKTIDEKYSNQANIDLGNVLPKILFYKEDSGLGIIWEKTLENGHKIAKDEVVLAVPYFISPKNIGTPTLSFNWFINDNSVNVKSLQKNLMPLKVPEGISGTSKLRLEIENQSKIFQTASKEINLEF